MNCAHIYIIATRTSEFELTGESIDRGAQTTTTTSISAQNKVNTHLNLDTSQNSSRETTPSRSEASKEHENETKDNFWDQEYDPIGPVDEMTELHCLSLLATSGVQIEEHSITHLQPLQGDQPAHHPLSNHSLSSTSSLTTSTTPSSATQNLQPANHLTLVVTGAGGRPKCTIRQHVQINEGAEDEGCSASHCEDPHRVGFSVKCTGVGCSLQVSILV